MHSYVKQLQLGLVAGMDVPDVVNAEYVDQGKEVVSKVLQEESRKLQVIGAALNNDVARAVNEHQNGAWVAPKTDERLRHIVDELIGKLQATPSLLSESSLKPSLSASLNPHSLY